MDTVAPSVALLASPWTVAFQDLIAAARTDLFLVAPFISKRPLAVLRPHVDARSLRVRVLTNLSVSSMIAGSLDIAALAAFAGTTPNTTVTHLPSLHAKVYIADEDTAIITSGNLTNGGLSANAEYGMLLRGKEQVIPVLQEMRAYASLGGEVSDHELSALAEAATTLRALHQDAERQRTRQIKAAFAAATERATITLLRARVGKQSVNALFSETILYLLQKHGPLSTAALQPLIQQVHPDLCDDTVDRVIDGKHYGKKWKHSVRGAQVTLQRAGRIVLRGDTWSLV